MAITRYLRHIKLIAFLSIFYLLFSCFSDILYFNRDENLSAQARNKEFYSIPKESIDILFLGGSAIGRDIIPLKMWDKFGFTSYSRANPIQGTQVSYYLLAEALNYQTPDVVIIETITMTDDFDVDRRETDLRIAIDTMKFSKEKLQLIQNIVSNSKIQTVSSYIFPLLRFHSGWETIQTPGDFNLRTRTQINPYKGFFEIRLDSQSIEFPEDYMQPTDDIYQLSSSSKYYYEEIIRLCQEKGIPVLLVTMPRAKWDYSKHLAVQQFADQYGLSYIDYCLYENWNVINLNSTTDFIDPGHLNYSGALKVSKHLGAYLQEKYHLQDKRNDQLYQQWNADLHFFKEEMDKVKSEMSR